MENYCSIPECIKIADTYIPPCFEKTGTRLYMNENLYGPSPKCLDVLKDIECDDLCKYTYGRNEMIEKKIADFCGLDKDYVLVNNGSSEVLKLIMEILIESGDKVLLPDPGWSYYNGIIMLDDGRVEKYSLKEGRNTYFYDTNEIVNRIKKCDPKLVVITSPNMPTGNRIEETQLETIISALDRGFLVLDEAYFGFSKENLYINDLLKKFSNLIVVRTFSKCYGLAALRVGYMLCSPLLKNFFEKKSPLFGISYPAQVMTAVALDDTDYYKDLISKISCIREEFIQKTNKLKNFHCFQSDANFILVRIYGYSPAKVVQYLKDNGYLIRDCRGYELHHHVRISIGREHHMKQIYELLANYSE